MEYPRVDYFFVDISRSLRQSVVPKRVGLPRTEYPSGAGPLVVPNRHCLIKANNPSGKEYGSHVVVPRFYHLADLPDLVDKRRSLGVRKLEVPRDSNKTLPRHVVLKIVGAWILLLVALS